MSDVMRALFLSALVSGVVAAQDGRFDRFNTRCAAGRSDRGLPCGGESYAFFELAPSTGAGMGSACACTNPTGAKGEALTFTRASAATCNPLGAATTGITDSSFVECSSNLLRVEASNSGRGPRVEPGRSNLLLRFIGYCDAAWSDVGTPALTGQAVAGTACATTTPQNSPWSGTYATAAVSFNDDNAAAFEGRSQSVTVTASQPYTLSCWAKAGTLSTARLTLDGTAQAFTGLSTSTWTLLSVTDASASGVSIAAEVLNGNSTGSTGTVIWGGCQVEQYAQVTAMIPTEGATASRAAEVPYVALPVAMPAQTGCMAVTVEMLPGSATTGIAYDFMELSQNVASGDVILQYLLNGATRVDWVASAVRQNSAVSTPFGGGPHRYLSTWDGATLTLFRDGVQIDSDTGAAITTDPMGYLYFGTENVGGSQLTGIITRVQVDPSPTRCTP